MQGEAAGQRSRDGDRVTHRRHLDFAEEAHRHRDERLRWPRVEPVDDRARGERGELAAAVAHVGPDGRHAEHRVQVLAHAVDEEVPVVVARVHEPGGLDLGADRVDDVVGVVGGVGNVSAREQIVQVDEHVLVHDLRRRRVSPIGG